MEAAFWRRLRAGVSAVEAFLLAFVFHLLKGDGALPPEPESSFLDGLDVRDWTVPDRPLPEVCDGLAGIVPNTRRFSLGQDDLQT